MKRILLISLLILISSKINVIEFGKDIPLVNDTEFEFTYDKKDNLFFKITANDSFRFELYTRKDTYIFNGNKETIYYITEQIFLNFNKIKIQTGKNVKGTFWINPSLVEIKIDLNSTVEWDYFIFPLENKPKLTYVIDNAEKNATFIFKYDKKWHEDLPNPFEVCHGTDCRDQITTYKFKKGESYKIYVYTIEKNNKFYFPRFSFFDKTKEKEKEKKSNSFNLMLNLWSIILLLFML